MIVQGKFIWNIPMLKKYNFIIVVLFNSFKKLAVKIYFCLKIHENVVDTKK